MPADPTRLQIVVRILDDATLLRLSGELDTESATALLDEADRLVEQGQRNLILDCAALSFCDSSGLRAMTQVRDQVQPDGSVTIARPSALLLRILQITGLAACFLIPAGRAEAPAP